MTATQPATAHVQPMVRQPSQEKQEPFCGESFDELNSDKSLLRVTTDIVPHNAQFAKDSGIPLSI